MRESGYVYLVTQPLDRPAKLDILELLVDSLQSFRVENDNGLPIRTGRETGAEISYSSL